MEELPEKQFKTPIYVRRAHKAYADRNPEKVKEMCRNYRENNKEKVAAMKKAYYLANKEKLNKQRVELFRKKASEKKIEMEKLKS